MHKTIRMLAMDLDNTLLNAQKQISPRTARALEQCQEHGILTAFATARPFRMTAQAREIFMPDYVLADNGAVILQGEQLLRRQEISRETVSRFLVEALAEPRISIITLDDGEYMYTNYQGNDWDGMAWNAVYTDFSTVPEGTFTKLSTECPQMSIMQRMVENYPELSLYGNTGEPWQQIQGKNASKFSAIEYIAAVQGLSPQNVAAFGDDHNDIAMLRGCGVGIAMQNANLEAQAAADEICGYHDEDGIAIWIEQRLLK